MQRVFLVLTLLLLYGREGIPQWTMPLHVPVVASAVSCTGSDNFTGSGALSPCWTTLGTSWTFGNSAGVPQQSSGNLINFTGGFTVAPAGYTAFTTSSAAQITLVALPTNGNFMLCLHGDSAGNGYCYDNHTGQIQKVVAGALTGLSIFGCGGAVVGDTYKITASGTGPVTLTTTNVTTSTTLCSGSDSSSPFTTGYPVVLIDNSSGGAGVELTNFVGTP